jgi:glycerol uptake facilitator-like aquaporin
VIKNNFNKEFCEFLGTAVLCFLVIGNSAIGPSKTPFEGSLFAGSVVMLIIYAVGTISGAHINPAVSLGFFFSKKFAGSQLIKYAIAQILGSLLALLLLIILFSTLGKTFDWSAAAPRMASPIGIVLEAFLTSLLIFIILSVATGDCRLCPDARPLVGIIIGTAIAMLSYFAGSQGVGVLNPVVPLIFAIMAGTWSELIKYLFAMSLGALIAVFWYQITRNPTILTEPQE